MSLATADTEVAAAVDRLLLERGGLDFFELLLRLNLIDTGGALLAASEAVADTLDAAHAYASQQGLRAASGAMFLPLPARCRVVMSKSPRSQFDLLRDNQGLYAESQLRDALLDRRFDAASELLARVEDANAHGEFAQLVEAATTLAADNDAGRIEKQLSALAHRRLGDNAAAYLRGLWSALAERQAGLRFDPECPQDHASHAWLQAGEAERAAEAIAMEPGWRDDAQLLARMALACTTCGRSGEARLAWMRLCWLHPQAAEQAFDESRADPSLLDHWSEFQSEEAAYATEEFPAWMLIAEPGQRFSVPADQAPQTPAGELYRAVLALIASDGELNARRRVHALSPSLLKRYLSGL